uniref:mRNA decapping protein 2 Box A domain-containing protein n=1 Tax=Canis lupus dingo TaxID=286419 RepID=A0A8C0QZM1_CANLU
METKRVEIPGSVLDDLCSRFILHIPSEERDNAIRVCFQIELAHWFYLDFYMQNTPGLPQCGIRDFAKADILFITIMTVFIIANKIF